MAKYFLGSITIEDKIDSWCIKRQKQLGEAKYVEILKCVKAWNIK